MKVQSGFKPKIVKILQAVGRIREKFLLPGVACPSDSLAEFIFRRVASAESPCLVPVHVQNHYVDRNAKGPDFLAEAYKLEV